MARTQTEGVVSVAPRLEGQRVTRACFDYAATLCTESGFELRLGTTFVIRDPDGLATTIQPDAPGMAAVQVLALLHGAVDIVEVQPSGLLTVSFVDGQELLVRPHPEYEAWTIVGPRGERTVCIPGGGISEWSPTA